MTDREQACYAQHFGLWAIKPQVAMEMAAAYNSGQLPRRERPTGERRQTPVAKQGDLPKRVYMAGDDPDFDAPLYTVDETGVGFVAIDGQITKGRSSLGGTSNVQTRQALRAAEADSDVRGIMVMVDSPGGTVAGTKPMSDEVARIAKSGRVPIVAHVEDAMHSAALWTGVQAQRVTASATSEIGCIGVLCVVHDYSKMYENKGIKVHALGTGEMKGAFTPGTEVTQQMLDELKERIEAINQFFLIAVKVGRNMPIEQVRALADGRDWLAAEAKERGLIDEVMSQDDAVRTFRQMIRQRGNDVQAPARRISRAAALAEMS